MYLWGMKHNGKIKPRRVSGNDVPIEVRRAAAWLIERYGCNFLDLGDCGTGRAYLFCFPDDKETGFPSVFIMQEAGVLEIEGFEALNLLGDLIED